MSRDASERPVALITGASAGIGAAYAEALARDGHDLILVARRGDRLEALATGLRAREGCRVECFAADLCDETGVRAVEARIDNGAPIHLLVNNAGRGSFGAFWRSDPEGEFQQTLLNAAAVQRLSQAALRRFVPARRGAIIFVSSLSGFQPGPYNATYSATKAFVNAFAHALREELRGSGVRIQLLCPGFTRTEFQQISALPTERIPRFAWTGAEPVVSASLAALRRDRFLCIPGVVSKVLGAVLRVLPPSLACRVAARAARPMLPPPSGA